MKMRLLVFWVIQGAVTQEKERTELIEKLQSLVHEREALTTVFGPSSQSLMEVMDCDPCPLSELKLESSSLVQLGCPPCVVPVAMAAPAVAIGGSVAITITIVALIAAGIIGGGAVAGVGAGLGGGLMGILVGMSGIFNSHKNRRRKNDNLMPCESYDPLDTNDHDCFVLRWNRMTWYFGAHRNMKRLQRLIVNGEDETEKLMNSVDSDFEHLHRVIFGKAGTFFKPNRDYGLIADVAKLKHVVGFLGEKAEDMNSRMEFTQEGIRALAESDLSAIKVLGIEAMGNLESDFADLLSSQQASNAMNTAVMTMAATRTLTTAALDIITGQKSAVDSMESSDLDRRLALSKALKQVDDLGTGIDIVEARMKNVIKQMVQREVLVQESMEADTKLAVSKVGDTDTKLITGVKRNMDNITFPISDLTKSEIIKKRADWKELVRQGILGMWNRAQELSDFVNAMSMRIFNEIMSLSAQNVSGAIDNSELELLKRKKEHEAMVSSIAQFLGWMIQNSQPDDVKTNVNEFETNLVSELERIKRLAKEQSEATGGLSKEGIAAIVATIASASSDAKSVLKMGESEYVSKVSGIMKMLGVENFDAAKLYNGIVGSLTSKGSESVIDKTDESRQSVGSLLLSALADLGLNTAEIERKNANKANFLDGWFGDLLVDSQKSVFNQLNGIGTLDNAKNFSRSQYSREVESARQAGSQLINTLFGLTGSSDSLAVLFSLYELSNGGNLESLGDALAKSDDRFADELEKRVNSSFALNGISKFDASGLVKELQKTLAKLNSNTGSDDRKIVAASETIRGLLSQLSDELDVTAGKVSDSQKSVKSEVMKALEVIMSQHGDKLTAYRAQYGTGMLEGTLQTVQSFVMALQEQRRLDLNGELENQREEAKKLGQATSAMDKLIAGLHAGVETIEAESGIAGSRFRDVETFNKMVSNLFKMSSRDLREVVERFAAMKGIVVEGFGNYSLAVADEVLGLPRTITEGELAANREMTRRISKLDSMINEMKTAIAEKRKKSDVRMAQAGLAVLNRLQNIQDVIGEIDSRVRTGVGDFENITNVELQRALAGFTVLRKAIGNITDEVLGQKTSRDIVDFQTRIDELRSVVEPVVAAALDGVIIKTDEEGLKQAVNWNSVEFRERTREALASTEVRNVTRKSEWYFNRTSNEQAVVKRLIEEVSRKPGEAMKSVSEAAGLVLKDLTTERERIELNTKSGSDDIVTRQAVVKQAMRAFLELLREIGYSVASRNSAIAVRDKEMTETADIDVGSALSASERELNTTRGKIARFHTIVSNTEKAQSEFEDSVKDEVRALNETLQKFNQRRNTLFVNSGGLMNELTATNRLVIDGMSHEIDRVFEGDDNT
jgi:hypothetical protein